MIRLTLLQAGADVRLDVCKAVAVVMWQTTLAPVGPPGACSSLIESGDGNG